VVIGSTIEKEVVKIAILLAIPAMVKLNLTALFVVNYHINLLMKTPVNTTVSVMKMQNGITALSNVSKKQLPSAVLDNGKIVRQTWLDCHRNVTNVIILVKLVLVKDLITV
jgi:hypothetical protein